MAHSPVFHAIAQHAATLAAARRVFVAYSGGLDSTALLHTVAKSYPNAIGLHANHGLHGDAKRWAQHCEEVCQGLDIAFESTELVIVDAGEGLEAAARTARYRWFEELLSEGDVLLMAHHQDDQAETLLLRLLRGAGPEGLSGMPVSRRLGSAALLRPLLGLPRAELKAYAEAHGLIWVDDPSNSDVRFDRNYLRQELMPLLAQRWPGYRATLSRAATQLRELNEYLPAPYLATVTGSLQDPGFQVNDLPDEPALAALSLRKWLRERSLTAPPSVRLLEFLRQLREGAGAQLCGAGWIIERYRDAVYVLPIFNEERPLEAPVRLGEWQPWPGMGHLKVVLKEGAEPLDLALKSRQGGERIEFASGQRKDLKTVFQELEVPPWWRDRLPLLALRSGPTEELLAVADLRYSPRAASLGVEVVRKGEEFPEK
ncbi:tRNA lysidine(34) synthetase TilS [Congregibacter brevis]|uniref:tRNA(Ile)-lysidine synthase n=1 Tax=Congregibacter brevis TaxID=3081201 RepID=A0ABZ0I794_9GAMM|nr:tRNA lysidine(34) synthetase TilS [Congregibacter sp. IMCC45268]